jgi:predicted Zn finger-like uncharacterized protein
MIVECPNCRSTFNLDEELVPESGAKVRCSVCDHVFVAAPESPEEPSGPEADGEQAAPEPEAPTPEPEEEESGVVARGDIDMNLDKAPTGDVSPRKWPGRRLIAAAVISALLVIGGAVLIYFMFPDLSPMAGKEPASPAMGPPETEARQEAAPAPVDLPKVRAVVLDDIRQYYVDNDQAGRIFVVEGKAANSSQSVKELIKLEVGLFDENNEQLASKTFLAGNSLDLYGLQTLTRDKIQEALSDKMGIAEKNTDLEQGEAAPFMAVFFDPPPGLHEFVVKVVDVKDAG